MQPYYFHYFNLHNPYNPVGGPGNAAVVPSLSVGLDLFGNYIIDYTIFEDLSDVNNAQYGVSKGVGVIRNI